MSSYRFTVPERFAVWKAHGEQCFWCERPLRFPDATVDHVVAEAHANATDLNRIKTLYALPAGFTINSYENWVPAHPKCNERKSHDPFTASPALVQIFERLRKKAKTAEDIEISLIKQRKLDSALAALEAAVEAGLISWEDVKDRFTIKPEGLGLGGAPQVTLHVDANWQVLAISGHQAVVTNGRNTGYTPIDPSPDTSWLCFHCHNYGPWSGARCLSCGQMSHPDY